MAIFAAHRKQKLAQPRVNSSEIMPFLKIWRKQPIICSKTVPLEYSGYYKIYLTTFLTRQFQLFYTAAIRFLPSLSKAFSQSSISLKVHLFDQNFLRVDI